MASSSPQQQVASPQQKAAMPQQNQQSLLPQPAVPPQMAEAAQTLSAGLWPAFARQANLGQALAAGLPPAPMNAKAEQQPALNNGGLWTNLAALPSEWLSSSMRIAWQYFLCTDS